MLSPFSPEKSTEGRKKQLPSQSRLSSDPPQIKRKPDFLPSPTAREINLFPPNQSTHRTAKLLASTRHENGVGKGFDKQGNVILAISPHWSDLMYTKERLLQPESWTTTTNEHKAFIAQEKPPKPTLAGPSESHLSKSGTRRFQPRLRHLKEEDHHGGKPPQSGTSGAGC